MPDGSSHEAVVPGYVNPSIAVLLLLAIGCGIRSALLYRRERARTMS
ncbi:hypothetical protein [Streptomyces zagrosensis]|uniref:Uncharacterized protein n=1 Tax=Streptomyces zagrosensis TaxID=1042984 RepID=A0A7W9V2B2_9ACTN|nr:hypothetical protein [Streptomyces zagrosensis]MBB5940143.1 hypothetical protein [Streptomyces zagrosensis]